MQKLLLLSLYVLTTYIFPTTLLLMTHQKKPMGRPTFRIDGAGLTALREEAGLSQFALAQKVYDRAGKSYANVGVMKTSAGRWESKGSVPLNMVRHLAEALKTTTAVLQGERPEPPPSRIEEIESRIKTLIDKSPSSKLAKALAQFSDETSPVRGLAAHIASRLEAAALSQAQHEFNEIAALTGYSESELRRPSSHVGFWMLIGTGAGRSERSEILKGVDTVRHEVLMEIQSFFENQHESDGQIAFVREKHWVQVTLHHARISRWSRTLRFARCQPNERGLQWVSPTWLDEFWLKEIPSESYAHANFVSGFDSVRVPTECTNLRFAITQNPGAEKPKKMSANPVWEIVALTAGDLADLHPETLASFKREGESHYIIVNWLAATLWEDLLPWMSKWPLECWKFSPAQSRIDVFLDVPLRRWDRSKVLPPIGPQLRVTLVEKFADGAIQTAPWRQKSVALICEKLQTSLEEARQAQAQSPPGLPPV